MGVFPSNSGAIIAGAVAMAAGFTDAALVTAIAVAGGESTFDPNKWNDKPSETPRGEAGPCVSVGLWQINYCPGRDDANPNRGAGDPKTLLDPFTNAKAAYAISSGGANWSPWGAYTSGAHVKWLEDARKSADLLNGPGGKKIVDEIRTTGKIPNLNAGGDGGGFSIGGFHVPNPVAVVVGGTSAVIGAVKGVAGIVTNPLEALIGLVKFIVDPKNWLRVLAVLIGGVLLIVGVASIIVDQNPEVAKAAATAAIVA